MRDLLIFELKEYMVLPMAAVRREKGQGDIPEELHHLRAS